MKNFGMDGENNTCLSGLRYAEIMHFPSGRFLRLNRSAHEGTNSSNRRHRRQRAVSNGGSPRRHRTSDQYAVWVALRHARWRNAQRSPGLFPATPRAWSSDSATRNKSPGEYLRAPFTQGSLDYLSGRSRQPSGEIRAAGGGLAYADL